MYNSKLLMMTIPVVFKRSVVQKMKKTLLLFGLFLMIVESTGADFGKVSNGAATKKRGMWQMPKEALRWIQHGAPMVNVLENYDFETKKDDNATYYGPRDTDMRSYKPQYSDGGFQPIDVNETSYDAYATDATGNAQYFVPLPTLYSSSGLNSNLEANFYLVYNPHLASRCVISDDSRTLGETSPFFRLSDGSSPAIHQGVLLYRSNSTGYFNNGWDSYVYISQWQSVPNMRLAFPAGMVVQIAVLYELDNYDTGWWIFQNHVYYHEVAIYQFNTTSVAA